MNKIFIFLAMVAIMSMSVFAIDVYTNQDLSTRSTDVMAWDADHGDDGTTAFDYSDSSFVLKNLTYSGVTPFGVVPGIIGNSYSLNDSIEGTGFLGIYSPVSNDDFKALSNNATIQFWLYIQQNQDFGYGTSGYIIQMSSSDSAIEISINPNPGQFSVYLKSSAGEFTEYLDFDSLITSDYFFSEWHHYAIVLSTDPVDDPNYHMYLYVDGQIAEDQLYNSDLVTVMNGWSSMSGDINIGLMNMGGNKRYLDEFVIDSTVLTFTNGTSACSNGLDDDMDGNIDYPLDDGCESAEDDTEFTIPECYDTIDNDADGATDSSDYSCSLDNFAPEDTYLSECQDSTDNDGDGWSDYSDDPGCDDAQDNDESDTIQCNDSTDNDGDDATDLDDSDCADQFDDSEYGSFETVPETPTGAVVATSRLVNLTDSLMAPVILVVVLLSVFGAAGLSKIKRR